MNESLKAQNQYLKNQTILQGINNVQRSLGLTHQLLAGVSIGGGRVKEVQDSEVIISLEA